MSKIKSVNINPRGMRMKISKELKKDLKKIQKFTNMVIDNGLSLTEKDEADDEVSEAAGVIFGLIEQLNDELFTLLDDE